MYKKFTYVPGKQPILLEDLEERLKPLEKRILDLETYLRKIQDLEDRITRLEYAPGIGPKYFEAKDHFETLKEGKVTK